MSDTNTGRFVWHELLTTDPKAAIAFYTDVVGWTTQPFGDGPDAYTMWVGSQGPLGGVMTLPEQAKKMGAPPHWAAHVSVADVDATLRQARELGGQVYKEGEDIPTIGRFGIIGDPQGASIFVFRPESPMTAHDTEKPGEFCWSELLTSDQDKAFAFYNALFGWEKLHEHNMGPMGTYVIFGKNGQRYGGMMTKSKDAPMPPAWGYYIEIAGLDAAVAKAVSRGAKVLNGPMEVPGGARVAQLTDPQGVVLALHEKAKTA